MMGLTDRVQPWARRFQRARPTNDTPEPKTDADRIREEQPRSADTRMPGRFVRRALQGQER